MAIVWAKKSAVYNWGNIGGYVDPYFEQWYAAGQIIPYISLLLWIVSILLSLKLLKNMPTGYRIAGAVTAITLTPIAFVCADYWFHRGFPIPAM